MKRSLANHRRAGTDREQKQQQSRQAPPHNAAKSFCHSADAPRVHLARLKKTRELERIDLYSNNVLFFVLFYTIRPAAADRLPSDHGERVAGRRA